jgi:hypothetical protein
MPARWNPGWCQQAHLNFFKCYWLPEFPPSDWPVETSTCQHCQIQAHVGHGTARIGFWPLNKIIWSSWQRPSSGDRRTDWLTDWLTAVSASWEKYNTPHHEVASFCWVKPVEMTLEINICELTTPFECCMLETEQMETRGSCLRFWYRKCITWVKKLFSSNLLLRR